MDFFFKKKQMLSAFAELIEDGRTLMNQELKKAKYNEYQGAEPMVEILVRVFPDNELPFEVKMKAGITKTYLLKAGVRVKVKYDAAKKQPAVLDDETQAILERNPQLIKK